MTKYIHKEGRTVILTLQADNHNEAAIFHQFAREGDPLTAELHHEHHYTHPHLDIKKQIF